MRQEYERIQQTMKDQMKRATPFDKIKKFFSRKSKSTLCFNISSLEGTIKKVFNTDNIINDNVNNFRY
jgi:hypothetical protein